MADEATINSGLQIFTGNLQYQSRPTAFKADVTGAFGPTPGAITVTTTGTDVDLSKLTSPGLCWVQNTDATNYVQLGVYNTDQSEFYPIIRLLPGECYTFRLDPDVNKEYAGAGTGTTSEHNTLRLKAANASCIIRFEAFEL